VAQFSRSNCVSADSGAFRSKVCGRSHAGVAGSNPAREHGCLSVSCDCCVSSGRGLYVGLVTRPEESYLVWRVSVSDREASIMRRPWRTLASWGKMYYVQCFCCKRPTIENCDRTKCLSSALLAWQSGSAVYLTKLSNVILFCIFIVALCSL